MTGTVITSGLKIFLSILIKKNKTYLFTSSLPDHIIKREEGIDHHG